MEVINLYRWVDTNRDWVKGKAGGTAFIMKSDIRYERVMCDYEDISLIKIGRVYGKFKWLLSSIYIYCEGIGREENENRIYLLMSNSRERISLTKYRCTNSKLPIYISTFTCMTLIYIRCATLIAKVIHTIILLYVNFSVRNENCT